MKVIINIECALGESIVEDYLKSIMHTMCVNNNDLTYRKIYGNSYFYILNNVDKEIFSDNIDAIMGIFNVLYAKGKVYYFYMGEYD